MWIHTLKIINNIFNDIREIKGFSQDDLIEIKRALEKFKLEKSEQHEIDEYLTERFSSDLLNLYLEYINEIGVIIEQFIISKEGPESSPTFNYQHLKSGILDELKRMSNNLTNSKLNGRNTKRFLKNSAFLNDFLENTQKILDDINNLMPIVENSLVKVSGIYDDISYIWFEINKIKNPYFKLNNLPPELEKWDEIKELYSYFESVNIDEAKKKRKRKEITLISHFNDIIQVYSRKQGSNLNFYIDLVSFLHQINVLEEISEEEEELKEYINILDRKEIAKKLKEMLYPIVKTLVEHKIEDILKELLEFDEKFNSEKLFSEKISSFLPKVSNAYLDGLENRYQIILSDLEEYSEIKESSKLYSDKVNILYSIIEGIEDSLTKFELFLNPYEEILDSLKKIFANLLTEILRRRNEYEYYLKTIRKEKLRDSIRNFVSEKISELNSLMRGYQDKTSTIVIEEFPQLTQIRSILSEYKDKIQTIKDEVYTKLDTFKEKDIDIYQIIKQWEDNFTLKRQQLSFLLSLLLNKLFKSFKEVIEEEDSLFENLKDITEQNKTIDNLPLNFALSKILVDKLTEDEMNERIKEIQSKIENLSREINLYQSELTNLEETLANKVKIREGITSDKVQCGVCRKNFDFAKDQIIKCPFCGAVFHYLCVAFWLTKHGSCPVCQNAFLNPNDGLFESE